MAQKAQIVDLTKGYIPGDANTFPQNLVNTPNEDGEEKVLPILPYEGYNFMPTSYGYRSYFGETAKLNIGALPSRPQFILLYQLPTFKSRLIALCEDGIWLCDANTPSAAWTQVVTQAFNPLILEEWTHCIIENTLYFYKQGNAVVYYTNINATPELAILSFVPSFLNMAGQMGIFKAGTRLGFWDSANSVSWSSNLDLHDFTPSLETMAGSTIFGSIVGRIMLCKAHGEGFVVYSTRSVVGVDFSVTSNLLWDAKKVLDNTGIAHSRAVVSGTNDSEHYMYGTTGIYRVGGFSPSEGRYSSEAVLPELYDFLGKSRTPITLTLLQDRFLCFSAGSSDAIYGQTAFRTVAVDSYSTIVNWYLPTSEPPTPTVVVDKPLIVEIITSITTVNPTTTASKEANYTVQMAMPLPINCSTDIIAVVEGEAPGSSPAISTSNPRLLNYPTDELIGLLEVYGMKQTSWELFDHIPITNSVNGFLITGVRPGNLSFHAAHKGKQLNYLMATQENYWTELGIAIDRVISYYQDLPEEAVTPLIPSGAEEGQLLTSILSGRGRVEVLSSNDFLHHSMDDVGNRLVLRKYFSERYDVVASSIQLETPEVVLSDRLGALGYCMNLTIPSTAFFTSYTDIEYGETILALPKFDKANVYRKGIYLGRFSSAQLQGIYKRDVITIIEKRGEAGEAFSIQSAVDSIEAWKVANHIVYTGYDASIEYIPTDATIQSIAISKVVSNHLSTLGPYACSIRVNILMAVTIQSTIAPYDTSIEYLEDELGRKFESIMEIDVLPNWLVAQETTSAFIPLTYDASIDDTISEESKVEAKAVQGDFGYIDFEANLIQWDYFNPYTLDIISSTAASVVINPPVLTPTTGGDLNNRDTWSYSTYQAPSDAYYEQANGRFGIYSIGEGIGEVQVYSTPPAANTFQIGLNSVVTVPGTNFILQTGGIDTAYPMYAGSFVFDMQLKKWGKYKGDHMLMVETTPINSSLSSTITYTDLGMDAASFKGDGFLHPFSNEPADSYIKYGKLGVYRLGMTSLQEVRVHQAQASNYKVQIESSKEGLAVTDLSDEVTYSSNMTSTTYCSVSARWHSIKISGTFDLTGLEIRTKIAGRR